MSIYIIFEHGTKVLGYASSKGKAEMIINDLKKEYEEFLKRQQDWNNLFNQFKSRNSHRLFSVNPKMPKERKKGLPPDLTKIPKDRHEIVMNNYLKRYTVAFDEAHYRTNLEAIANGTVGKHNDKIIKEFIDIHGVRPEYNGEFTGGHCHIKEANLLITSRDKKLEKLLS